MIVCAVKIMTSASVHWVCNALCLLLQTPLNQAPVENIVCVTNPRQCRKKAFDLLRMAAPMRSCCTATATTTDKSNARARAINRRNDQMLNQDGSRIWERKPHDSAKEKQGSFFNWCKAVAQLSSQASWAVLPAFYIPLSQTMCFIPLHGKSNLMLHVP